MLRILMQGRGLSPLPKERRRPIIYSTRTLRTRQTGGLKISTAFSVSLLRAVYIVSLIEPVFMKFHGPPRPWRTDSKTVCATPGDRSVENHALGFHGLRWAARPVPTDGGTVRLGA
jgi:hypothetical protein